jgi:hypothetical protein
VAAFLQFEVLTAVKTSVLVLTTLHPPHLCFSFAVDGVEVSGADKYGAVIDTGSTAIYVPRSLYFQLPDKLVSKGVRHKHFNSNMKVQYNREGAESGGGALSAI